MGFWNNVESELEYQGISRKELAFKAGISYAGIGLGIERDSMPGADTALKISKVLNVSIEYLLTGTDAAQNKDTPADNELLNRYRTVVDDLDKIPEPIKDPICQMIHRISKQKASF